MSSTNPLQLSVNTFLASAFSVISYECLNQAFNADYQFVVRLRQSDHDLKTLLGQSACLSYVDALGQTFYLYGIISKTQQKKKVFQGKALVDEITLYSPLHALALNQRNYVYHDVDLSELIQKVLQKNNLILNQDYQVTFSQNYPKRAYVAQYHETDIAFLQRHCAYWGVYFTVQQQALKPMIIFSDVMHDKGVIELPFIFPSQMQTAQNYISDLNVDIKALPNTVRLNDYHALTPTTPLRVEKQSNSTTHGHGLDYRHYEHYKNIDEGNKLLDLRMQWLDWQREVFSGVTDCPLVQPGARIKISGFPMAANNGEFQVLTVNSQANDQLVFKAKITLIRAHVPYRPHPIHPPLMPDCLANITSDHVDEQGSYFVKPKFDTSLDTNTYPVRLLQPYSGKNYGMHFPLTKGTEVLLTHINGDPDRPVIAGMLPNQESLSPVNAANKAQHILRTPSGHQLLMDDNKDKEQVLLHTADRQLLLHMDSTRGVGNTTLRSAQGNVALHAGQTMTQQTHAAFIQQVGGNHSVKAEKNYQLETNKGDINLQAGKDLGLKAKENIFLSAQQPITLNSQQNTVFHAKQNTVFNNKKGDVVVTATQGNIVAKGNNVLQVKGKSITLSQAGSSISISSSGIIIKAKTVNFQTSTVLGAPPNYSGGSGQTLSDNPEIKNLDIHIFDDANCPATQDVADGHYVISEGDNNEQNG